MKMYVDLTIDSLRYKYHCVNFTFNKLRLVKRRYSDEHIWSNCTQEWEPIPGIK